MKTIVGYGADAAIVDITATVARGPTSFTFEGPMHEHTARETKVRVRAALVATWPDILAGRSIVVKHNSPQPLRGGHYDLAIALAIAEADDILSRAADWDESPQRSSISDALVLGELSLTGVVRPVRGVFPALIEAKRRGYGYGQSPPAIIPLANANEIPPGDTERALKCLTPSTLREAFGMMRDGGPLTVQSFAKYEPAEAGGDMSEIRGLWEAKRALEHAAATGQNVLMVGSGTGATSLSRRFATLIPPLTKEEASEVTSVASYAGLLPTDAITPLSDRPFRAPHHTVSKAGLIGAVDFIPRPGELSLATHGVLLLDQADELPLGAREALIEALKEGAVRRWGINTGYPNTYATFPARPAIVIATAKPCPCGHRGSIGSAAACVCVPTRIAAHEERNVAWLRKLCPIQVEVPWVHHTMFPEGPEESSATIRARVIAARAERGAK